MTLKAISAFVFSLSALQANAASVHCLNGPNSIEGQVNVFSQVDEAKSQAIFRFKDSAKEVAGLWDYKRQKFLFHSPFFFPEWNSTFHSGTGLFAEEGGGSFDRWVSLRNLLEDANKSPAKLTLGENQKIVYATAFSKDGNKIGVLSGGSYVITLSIFDTKTFKRIAAIPIPNATDYRMSVSNLYFDETKGEFLVPLDFRTNSGAVTGFTKIMRFQSATGNISGAYQIEGEWNFDRLDFKSGNNFVFSDRINCCERNLWIFQSQNSSDHLVKIARFERLSFKAGTEERVAAVSGDFDWNQDGILSLISLDSGQIEQEIPLPSKVLAASTSVSSPNLFWYLDEKANLCEVGL